MSDSFDLPRQLLPSYTSVVKSPVTSVVESFEISKLQQQSGASAKPWAGSTEDVEAVWAASLAKYKHRLENKKLRGLVKQLDYDSFQSTLSSYDQRFRDRRLTKCLTAIAPSLRNFNKFAKAIDTAVQVQSNPLSIIWGSVQAALVVGSGAYEASKDVLTLIVLQ